MKSASSLAIGSLLAATLALVGCADQTSHGLTGPRADEVLVTTEDAPIDAEEVVIYPSDGPDGGAVMRTLGIMAVPASRDIRVGVVQSSAAITLGSSAAYEIRDKANGLLLLTGPAGTVATVTLVSAPASFLRLQVMCSTNLTAVAARKTLAESFGHPTMTQLHPTLGCTRLYVGQLPTTASTTIRNDFKNLLISQGIAQSDAFYAVVAVAGTSTIYRIVRGATNIQNVNPVVVTATGEIVTIGTTATNGLTYRGKGEARVTPAGTLAGINELPLQQYLYGVVPRELPPTSQWGQPEAQKAQAVAARTYAMRGYNKRSADGYDLRATTDDQVYGGYSAEHPVSSAAVDATAGVVATYQGELIDALFSSTAGGHTADSEEAFSYSPYLRGVPDRDIDGQWDKQADKTLEKFLKDDKPKLLLKEQKGDHEIGYSSYYRWSYEWTMEEMSGLISALAGQDVGRVLAINIVERGPSGRALKVDYVTEKAGTVSSGRDGSTRAALKYRNAAGAIVNLPSTRIFIEPTYEQGLSGPVTGYRVYGAGFGHGVGLSQTGAAGMAAQGYTYGQILKHYYTGIELTEPTAVATIP